MYYKVGLTNDEVAHGGLSAIADVVRDAFLNSSKQAIEQRNPNTEIKQAVIRFENMLTTTDMSEFGNYAEILYLNLVARQLVEQEDVNLSIIGQVEEVPENAGWLISMPIYSIPS